jgi:hypothetical protein
MVTNTTALTRQTELKTSTYNLTLQISQAHLHKQYIYKTYNVSGQESVISHRWGEASKNDVHINSYPLIKTRSHLKLVYLRVRKHRDVVIHAGGANRRLQVLHFHRRFLCTLFQFAQSCCKVWLLPCRVKLIDGFPDIAAIERFFVSPPSGLIVAHIGANRSF